MALARAKGARDEHGYAGGAWPRTDDLLIQTVLLIFDQAGAINHPADLPHDVGVPSQDQSQERDAPGRGHVQGGACPPRHVAAAGLRLPQRVRASFTLADNSMFLHFQG